MLEDRIPEHCPVLAPVKDVPIPLEIFDKGSGKTRVTGFIPGQVPAEGFAVFHHGVDLRVAIGIPLTVTDFLALLKVEDFPENAALLITDLRTVLLSVLVIRKKLHPARAVVVDDSTGERFALLLQSGDSIFPDLEILHGWRFFGSGFGISLLFLTITTAQHEQRSCACHCRHFDPNLPPFFHRRNLLQDAFPANGNPFSEYPLIASIARGYDALMTFKSFSNAFLAPLCALILPGFTTQAEITVKPAGLRLIGPGYGDRFGGGVKAFSSRKDVTVALMIRSDDGAIIAVDDDASKITSVTDDKDADLKQKGDFEFWGFPEFSDDRKAALIEIEGDAVPSAGNTRIDLKGSLALMVASKKETSKSEAVKPVKDALVKAGDFEFIISGIEKPDFGDAALSITLRIKRKIDTIAAFRFLDTAGNEIESDSTMSSSSGFNQNVTIERTFDLMKKPESFVLELDVWTDAKKLDLPFEISVGAGLESK